MKYTRNAACAAIGLVAVLSLTACGNDESGKGSSAKDSSSSSSSSSSSDGGSSSDMKETSNGKSGSGDDTASRAGSGNGSGKSAKKGNFCRTADLAMNASDTSPDKATGDVTVTMTNRGPNTCSATGFPGLDVKDKDGTSNPIERAGNQPRITNLKPGDTASFNVSFPLDHNGDSLADPTHLLVTPPNETQSVSLKWPGGAPDKSYAEGIKVHPVGIAS